MHMNEIKDTTCQSEVLHPLFANAALLDRLFVYVIRVVVLFLFKVHSENIEKKVLSVPTIL